jgi:hypothetical protein
VARADRRIQQIWRLSRGTTVALALGVSCDFPTIDVRSLGAVIGGAQAPKLRPIPVALTTGGNDAQTPSAYGNSCLSGAAFGGAVGAGLGALTGPQDIIPGAVGGAAFGCFRGMTQNVALGSKPAY